MKNTSQDKNPISLNEIDSLTDLNFLGLLRVRGSGAKALLQGQLTCNLDKISPSFSSLGAHCNPQGRIQSLFLLYQNEEDYYLQLPMDMLNLAMSALQKYAVFFKAKLDDASSEHKRYSYRGPTAEQYLLQIMPELPKTEYECLLGKNISLIKLPDVVPHYLLIGDIQLLQAALPSHTQTGSENTWKHSLISAGIPSVYTETSSKLLPHEINLQAIHAISFDKGCYTGQEIIARMHYRGQLKKHLYRAEITTANPPLPGDELHDKNPCGMIIDSCRITEHHYQILLTCDQRYAEEQQLFLDPAETVPVKFLTLPYVL